MSNWTAHLFHVASGQLGPKIEPKSGSWSMTINEIETLDMEFYKASLPKVEHDLWLEPWWAGVVLLYRGTPIFAGPITGAPIETMDSIKMNCKGIRAVLDKRYVVVDMADWSAGLSNIDVLNTWYRGYTNLSYGTLAKRAVQLAMQKPGGELPIRFTVPDIVVVDPTTDPETGAETIESKRPHTRIWAGYDIQNVNCESILNELSEVENGTDIMFRPVMLDANRVGWDMYTGLGDEHPMILQDAETVWDTTAVKSDISDLELTRSGANMAHRTFAIGSGSGGGVIIEMHQDLRGPQAMYPLLEEVVSLSSTNRLAVKSHAIATTKANQRPMHQLNATVRADGVNPLGAFWPGEYAKIVTKGWIGLNDGENRAKILTMSGDLTEDVKLGFKEEETI